MYVEANWQSELESDRTRRTHIFLDGVNIDNICYAADTDAGVAYCYALDADGKKYLDHTKHPLDVAKVELYGKVEIKIEG